MDREAVETSDEEFDYDLESHHRIPEKQTPKHASQALESTISAIDVAASPYIHTPQQDAVAQISPSSADTSVSCVHRLVQSCLHEFLTPQRIEAFFAGDPPEDLNDHFLVKTSESTHAQPQIDDSQDGFNQAVRDQIHLCLLQMRKRLHSSSQVDIA